jgi:hypothetical protein
MLPLLQKQLPLPTTKEKHLSRTATGKLMGHSQVEWPTPELENLTK